MERSDSIKELTAALAKAQIAFKPIKRTEQVDYQTTVGRKRYTYAPLSEVIEATKQALSDNGLTITQLTRLVEGNVILETLLSHTSGEWLISELYVGKQEQPPQSEGSALTYKRRYGMSAMLCVASEDDDDADSAMGKDKTVVTKPTKVEKPKVAVTVESEPEPSAKPKRDPASITNFGNLYQACAQDFGLKTRKAVWDELNIGSQEQIADTAEECYRKIAAVRQ